MLYLLAQAAPTQTPSIINNVIPAPNPWPVIVVALAGVLAGWGGHAIAHMLTRNRDRVEKLREGYAEFGSAAYRFLRLARKHQLCEARCRQSANVVNALDRNKSSPVLDRALDEMDKSIVAMKESDNERMESIDALRGAQCKLKMLLGGERWRILALENFCTSLLRVQPEDRRTPANSLSELIDRMQEDLDEWMIAEAAGIERLDNFQSAFDR